VSRLRSPSLTSLGGVGVVASPTILV
jgi:hypothetical protein